MTDETLISLLEQRAQQALNELDNTYGAYCWAIASNILGCTEDAEECVNDAYLAVWNAIPPTHPTSFKAWLGTIVRNRALGMRRHSAVVDALRSELTEGLSDSGNLAGDYEAKALGEAISVFLRQQPPQVRSAFVRRYWYCDSVEAVAVRLGWSVSKAKSVLFRTRKKLKTYLMKEELWYE